MLGYAMAVGEVGGSSLSGRGHRALNSRKTAVSGGPLGHFILASSREGRQRER